MGQEILATFRIDQTTEQTDFSALAGWKVSPGVTCLDHRETLRIDVESNSVTKEKAWANWPDLTFN